MPDELTDAQIALLCTIGERKAAAPDAAEYERLRAAGYLETGANGKLKLTKKAIAFLSERGAGLNEG